MTTLPYVFFFFGSLQLQRSFVASFWAEIGPHFQCQNVLINILDLQPRNCCLALSVDLKLT